MCVCVCVCVCVHTRACRGKGNDHRSLGDQPFELILYAYTQASEAHMDKPWKREWLHWEGERERERGRREGERGRERERRREGERERGRERV